MRYVVVPPVDGGYAFWNVTDTRSDISENFAMITIHRDTPWAQETAEWLCLLLNTLDRRRNP